MALLAFCLVVSIVVGFHEFAHLLAAKFFGVKVVRFSIGFGPKLVSVKLGETEYTISLWLLGGYVKPLTEDLTAAERGSEPRERYFESKPAWQRFLIFLAGPVSNLFLAFLLLAGLFYFVGLPEALTTLAEIVPNSPAMEAGLLPEDKIVAVNDSPVNSWEEVTAGIRNSNGQAINFKVERGTETLSFAVKPKEMPVPGGKRLVVGIVPRVINQPQSVSRSLKLGLLTTKEALKSFAYFFQRLFSGEGSRKDFGGMIMIYQSSGQSAQAGFSDLIGFIILLSLNLGVFNLLPIPLLDGGQLYPILFEMLTGIRPNKKFIAVWNGLGVVILVSLLLLGCYNDLERIYNAK